MKAKGAAAAVALMLLVSVIRLGQKPVFSTAKEAGDLSNKVAENVKVKSGIGM